MRRSRDMGKRPEAGLVLFSTFMTGAALTSSLLTIVLHRSSNLRAAVPPPPPSNAVIFVVDGAPADVGALRFLPNVAALRARGTTFNRAWLGQLEGVPPASDASIGTGVLPRKHGLIGWSWKDQAKGTVYEPTSEDQVRQGSIDQMLRTSGAPTLAGAFKAADSTAKVLSVGGSGCADAAALGTWAADFIVCPSIFQGSWVLSNLAGHALPADITSAATQPVPVLPDKSLAGNAERWSLGAQDDWVADATVVSMRETRPRLTFVDFPEPALVGRYVTESQRASTMRTLLLGIDRDIGKIINEVNRQGKLDRTVFVLVGSQAISPAVATIPISDIDQAILAGGGEKVYINGDAGVYLGVRDRLQAQPVAQALTGRHVTGIDGIYYKVQDPSPHYVEQYLAPGIDSKATRSMQFLLGSMAGTASPDVVVVYAPGRITPASASSSPQTAGGVGLSWSSQHVPLILAGPSVRPGGVSDYPARLVDIAPTLSSMLNLPYSGSDGVPLADSELIPLKSDVLAQDRAGLSMRVLQAGLRSAAGR